MKKVVWFNYFRQFMDFVRFSTSNTYCYDRQIHLHASKWWWNIREWILLSWYLAWSWGRRKFPRSRR